MNLTPGKRHFINEQGVRKPVNPAHQAVGYRHGTTATGWLKFSILNPLKAMFARSRLQPEKFRKRAEKHNSTKEGSLTTQ